MSLMRMHGLVWLETMSPNLIKRVSTNDRELSCLNRTCQSILTVYVTDLNWRLQANALTELGIVCSLSCGWMVAHPEITQE